MTEKPFKYHYKDLIMLTIFYYKKKSEIEMFQVVCRIVMILSVIHMGEAYNI